MGLLDEGGTVKWTEIPEMLKEDLSPENVAATECDEKSRRSSLSLLENQQPVSSGGPPQTDAKHRRIRSTGGTVDQELRRFEPEFGQTRVHSPTRSSRHWGASSSQAGCGAVDPLSKSYTHIRNASGYP